MSVTKHARMRAHMHMHVHTHIHHVLVNTHALSVSHTCNVQELSINQGVNVQEFICTLHKIFILFFSVDVFLCVCF